MFSHLFPEKPHKCVLKPSEQCSFFQDDDLRGHMPRFTLKMNILPHYVLGNTINVCWNPQNSARFSKTIHLRVTCLGLLQKWTFYHLCPWKHHKCVFRPSEQCSFLQDDWFERSHARLVEKFMISHLCPWKHHNVCSNPQNRALFFWDNQFDGSHA